MVNARAALEVLQEVKRRGVCPNLNVPNKMIITLR